MNTINCIHRSFLVTGLVRLGGAFMLALLLGLPGFTDVPVAGAAQTDIIGPSGSEEFGKSVTVLANGNIVVTDPYYNAGAISDVGAVYLYDGATLALISVLTGSTINDRVSSGGVTVLNNGNYVVYSPDWSSGSATDAGAVTWGSGTTGVSGVVSAANSLVGGAVNDQVGSGGVTVLNNGNYVVNSPNWNGAATNIGAVTWGNGTTGVSGLVSVANSLVGSTSSDQVGSGGVTALSNGNYVVSSQFWDNGLATDAGAVTWGSGTAGISDAVSVANSLVGVTASDGVGNGSVTALSNGNYVVSSPDWNNGAALDGGAATWGDGTTGISGAVTAFNSLTSNTANSQVGRGGVTALSNGNYVVSSQYWDNGANTDVGAVTWGDGTTGISGAVTAANSLVGSMVNDRVGSGGVTALSNGNYVVSSSWWNNGALADVGAVTWGNGTTGISGPVSMLNSLVGSQADDGVGSDGVTVLSNGNYVVSSWSWNNGAVTNAGAVTWGNGTTGISGAVSAANSLVGSWHDWIGSDGVTALSNGNYVVSNSQWNNGALVGAGAVTWGNGTTGISGPVSAANSLVGSTVGDLVGIGGVTALSNGNYVVRSRVWDNGALVNVGAVTWGNGTTGISGAVSATNSLVGSTPDDQIGYDFVTALANGNYVVGSRLWDNGALTDAGAVTWGNGTTGISGAVSAANSLVGSTADDLVSIDGVTALSNGDYVVDSQFWDNGALTDAGAITWGSGTAGISGPITAENSVRGETASGGSSLNFAYDYTHNQLVVGRPADNRVTIFAGGINCYLPLIIKNGS